MKYSILIPSYDPNGKRRDEFIDLIRSIEENSVGMDYEIIIRKNGASYTESHNDALRSSQGDFIVIMNDDTLVRDPQWLEKLAQNDCITSTKIGKFYKDDSDVWDFSCWCIPRPLFEKIGYLDERYRNGMHFEDNDYVFRVRELGIPFKAVDVDVLHYGNHTMNLDNFHDKGGRVELNHRIFCDKWKI